VQNNPLRYTDPSGHCPEQDRDCRIRLYGTLPKGYGYGLIGPPAPKATATPLPTLNPYLLHPPIMATTTPATVLRSNPTATVTPTATLTNMQKGANNFVDFTVKEVTADKQLLDGSCLRVGLVSGCGEALDNAFQSYPPGLPPYGYPHGAGQGIDGLVGAVQIINDVPPSPVSPLNAFISYTAGVLEGLTIPVAIEAFLLNFPLY
jgi:hypothetical protein